MVLGEQPRNSSASSAQAQLNLTIFSLNYHRLVYRDIKPENVGFDIRGDVKLFDFGLCRSLEPRDKVTRGYGYNLTAKTGSIPYMAPEVAMGEPYGHEADVFSFGILLWEILSLSWAFNGYSTREYFDRVAKNNERLPLPSGSPPMIRSIIPEGTSDFCIYFRVTLIG
jgi:serine/threonine protein kinase